jgi:poly-beta-1,6-N-acetyl-D-glucosamine synthase
MHFPEIVWWISLAILTGYHLFIFRSGKSGLKTSNPGNIPGVSVVIAVKNGSDMLQQNLPHILSQEYPMFEVIIVDDHSDEVESEKLKKIVQQKPHVSWFQSDLNPGKKYALGLGIDKAKYDLILCTDADCRPMGQDWIKSMVKQYPGNDIVLGYSPYSKSNGWLNRFVRFETVMTGIQYLSWAMRGRAYMGVGRNMLYARSLFQKIDPYKNQKHIPYGDDDLWIQQASATTKIGVSIDKASHVISAPATSWKEWVKQKHRHMSAAHHYDKRSWWQPGLYGLALMAHWFLLPFVLPGSHLIVVILFVAGLVIRWMTYDKWSRELGDRDTIGGYPFLEAVHALYLAGVGVFTMFVKKKKWS